MKKTIVTMSLMLTVAVTSVFANPEPITGEEAQETFKKEFAGAQSVVWKTAGEYTKASFIFHGFVTEAYFNEAGELEGTIRSLRYDQLPLSVMTSVNKRFANADVLDVYEISNSNGTTYQLTLKSEGKKYRIKADTAGNISEKEKMKN